MHTWVVIVVYTEFEWGLSFKNKFQICNIKMNLKIGNWIFHLSVLKKNRRNESHIEHKLYLNILRCTFKMQNIILRKKREIATITIHLANLIVANKNKCWIWKKNGNYYHICVICSIKIIFHSLFIRETFSMKIFD